VVIEIGLVLFPKLTQLDLTGPFETFARIPGARVHLAAKRRQAITSDTGLAIVPTTTFRSCPDLDVICVPGGPGVNEALLDDELLAFVRRQGERARYVTSVCSGSLLLGAAGLLRGYRASTHWASTSFLAAFGATASAERICVDRNRITGAGVTAGIDFGLYVAALLAGDRVAQRIQLYLEYAPDPPFHAGSPDTAPAVVVRAYEAASADMLERRREAVGEAAQRLAGTATVPN
jgi:cyclohexyl-isocyanide hydratase